MTSARNLAHTHFMHMYGFVTVGCFLTADMCSADF